MIISSAFQNVLDEIKNDYKNGSMTIAKKSIDTFFTALSQIIDYNDETIYQIAWAIKETKPTMSALQNAIDLCIVEYNKNKTKLSLEHIKTKILEELENHTLNCLNSALNYLESFEARPFRIVTCSYSSTFLALMKKLAERSLVKEIYVLESIWRGISYSKNTIKMLNGYNIKAYEIALSKLAAFKNLINCAIIGADRVLEDGSVINGVPSLSLAKEMSGIIPFFVIAEKIKLTNQIILEEGFEIVPNHLISKIFM